MLLKGIRSRLFFLIVLAVLPLFLLIGWISWQGYESRRDLELQTELEVGRGVATTFSAYIDGMQQKNFAIGQAILLTSQGDRDQVARLLESTANQSPVIRNLSWVDPNGTVIASSFPDLVGRDMSIRAYFQEVKQGKPWAIGDLTNQGIATAEPTFAIATGVRDSQGTLSGVVVAALEPNHLNEITLTQKRPQGGDYIIFDSQGAVVYRNVSSPRSWDHRTRWIEDDTLLQKALQTMQEQTGITHIGASGEEWISARVPIAGLGYVVGAGRPVKLALAPLQQRLVIDALLALGVGALAYLLALLLARTISRPISRLADAAQQMSSGAQVRLVDDGEAPSEVRALRSNVEQMANDLIKRAEALRESEERFRTSIESLLDGFAILSAIREGEERKIIDFCYEYINEAGCRMIQQPCESLSGRRLSEMLPDFRHSSLFHRYIDAVETSNPVVIENERKEKLFGGSGQPQRIYEVSAVRLEDGLAVTWRDITERKQLEEELQQYAQQLEQSNNDLQNFAFMASHDLNEPLRKIVQFGHHLREKLENSLDEQNRDMLIRMQNAAERMQAMVDALLDLSRVTTQGRPFESVDLLDITKEVISDLEALIYRTEGEVTVSEMPVIQADPIQIRHLLQNLISNSLKFHQPDVPPRVKVSARRLPKWDGKGPVVAIQVEDNGIGFDMDNFERILQPFQRLHGRGTYEGTGMGLAICKRIVERHQGKLEASSQPGKGSIFTIILPIERSEP